MWSLLLPVAFAAVDADGDGYTSDVDCNDADASVYPGAVELCDGQDNDCDGFLPIPEEDLDGDGFVSCGQGGTNCEDHVAVAAMNGAWTWAGSGAVVGGCDCYDAKSASSALQYPSNTETCEPSGTTQLDNDCDGNPSTDGGVTVSGAVEYFLDADGDGYGDPGWTGWLCDLVDGYAVNSDDCDDRDSLINPTAPEVCNGRDDDCDGLIDNEDAYSLGDHSGCLDLFLDGDEDGYGDVSDSECLCLDEGSMQEDGRLEVTLDGFRYTSRIGDCYDHDAQIHPGAPERMNGMDDDCDGRVAYAEADCDRDNFRAEEPTEACTADQDVPCAEDGIRMAECDAETGWLMILAPPYPRELPSGDCDDQDSSIHPSAPEIPGDGIDQDCDGEDPDPPQDTGSPNETGDSSEPFDTASPSEERPGCGCSSQESGQTGALAVLLLGLVGLMRRRDRYSGSSSRRI